MYLRPLNYNHLILLMKLYQQNQGGQNSVEDELRSNSSDRLQQKNIIYQENHQQLSQKQKNQGQGTRQSLTNKENKKQQKQEVNQQANKNHRSFFHNFQKHLVITLKMMIRIKQCKTPDRIKLIGATMWKIFKDSKNNSKTSLLVLFGVQNDFKEQQNHLDKPNLQKLGFLSIYEKFQIQQIEQAQEYLRKQTINQLRAISDQDLFQKRKIEKREQFKRYMQKFLEEIETGPMRRRLLKHKARQVKKMAVENR